MNTNGIEEAQVVEMHPTEVQPKESKPEFNPATNYSWRGDADLIIKGAELHLLHNAISDVFNGDKHNPALMYMNLAECLKATTAILKRGVENNQIEAAK